MPRFTVSQDVPWIPLRPDLPVLARRTTLRSALLSAHSALPLLHVALRRNANHIGLCLVLQSEMFKLGSNQCGFLDSAALLQTFVVPFRATLKLQ
jgi:hypothetical protein